MIVLLRENETDLGIHNPKSVNIKFDTTVFISEPFKDFNPQLLKVYVTKIHEFNCYLNYSFDAVNWSKDFKLEIDELMDDEMTEYINRIVGLRDLDYFPNLYIALRFEKVEKFVEINQLKQAMDGNVIDTIIDGDIPQVDFCYIDYNGKQIHVENDTLITQNQSTNNRFPIWNIYQNYDVFVKQWLDRIDATTWMVGHPIIYFKTAVKTESNTLQTADELEVISIKRFKVTFPSNQLPKDTMIYADSEYMMMDDSYAEISWRIFKQIFGEKSIPDKGDLMFIPILNKMFKVVLVEPDEDKKFMGKIGWFNVYLSKYTQDDTLHFEDEMVKALNYFDDEDLGSVNGENVMESFSEFVKDTVLDRSEILADTNEEKKKVTENYTNKFLDTTSFVAPKDTDSIRKNINKRIEILDVNPSQNTFPVKMYNCQAIERKQLCFEYDLNYLQKLSKLNLYPKTNIMLSFNLVSIGRNTSQIFEILSGDLMQYSIQLIKGKINVLRQQNMMESIEFDHVIKDNEYYQVNVEIKQRSVSLHLYILRDKTKKLIFKDLYIDNFNLFEPTQTIIDGLCLFGGKFLIGEPSLNIDDENIMTDYINPVLDRRGNGI